jgi:hypothetical protein
MSFVVGSILEDLVTVKYSLRVCEHTFLVQVGISIFVAKLKAGFSITFSVH